MMHRNRTWSVTPINSAGELARMLSEHTWAPCTAFELAGTLFLNDSTGPDGAQEYAIVRRLDDGRFLQVESITFGWCDHAAAHRHILRAIEGRDDGNDFAAVVAPHLETPEQHRRCPLCA